MTFTADGKYSKKLSKNNMIEGTFDRDDKIITINSSNGRSQQFTIVSLYAGELKLKEQSTSLIRTYEKYYN